MKRFIKSIGYAVAVTIVAMAMAIPLYAADPVTVDTSTTLQTTDFPYQTHVISTGSYLYAFYSDGADAVYSFSANGLTWSAPAVVLAGVTTGSKTSVVWDGTHIHWLRTSVAYKRLLPAGDGTLAEASTLDVSAYVTNEGNLFRLSNGYMGMIGTKVEDDAIRRPRMFLSDDITGGWNSIFSDNITTTNTGNFGLQGLVYGNDVYILAANTAAAGFEGRWFYSDNLSWGALETINTGAMNDWPFFSGAIDTNGDIYVAFNDGGNTNYLRKRTYSTGSWGTRQTINTTLSAPTISWDSVNDIGYVFYGIVSTPGYVRYKLFNSTLEIYPEVTAITDAAGTANDMRKSVASNHVITANGYLIFTYPSGTVAPYNVQVETYSIPVVTTDNVSFSVNKSGVLSGYFGATLSDNGTAPALVNAVGWGAVSDVAAPYSYTYYAYSDNDSIQEFKPTNVFSLAAQVPGSTYYYRAGADFRGWGNQLSFTTTAPTITTSGATNLGSNTPTLNGNLTSLGTCSDVYGYFQYGATTAYGSTTTAQTLNATGTYSATVIPPSWPSTFHYRAVIQVGTTLYYGADNTVTQLASAPVAATFKISQLLLIIPLMILALMLVGSGVLSVDGYRKREWIELIIGIMFFAVSLTIFPIILTAIDAVIRYYP